MKITQVSYLKTFPLGQFINEKIEITIDLNEGDDVQSALSLARSECELNHKKNNPHLYQEQDTIQERQSFREVVDNHLSKIEESKERFNSLQPIDNQPQKLSQKELILQEISNATTPKQLKEWKLLSDNYPELKEIYELKLKELTK